MKAKIEPRINLENRTRLETVIPLSTPFIIFVDPSSSCNSKCNFCPTGDHYLIKETGRCQGQMNFDLYKKIVNNIKEFDKPLKVLRLYKDGEPLLNQNLDKMIKYAKDTKYIEYIDTTTNGFLITPERMKPIIEAGIDKINISINGMSDEQLYCNTGTKINFNKYVKNITNLCKNKGDCEIVIKTNGDLLSEYDKQKFYETFGDICDRIFIENMSSCWNNFDVEERTNIKINSSKGIYNNELSNVNTCPYIFYQMSINSDGTVSLCFLDWQHKILIGDVRKQSIKEIWNNNILLNYQFDNLYGKRNEFPICKNCGQLKFGMPDNIDAYANLLINKLKIIYQTGN